MAIKFLNTVAVDTDVLYVDASNDRVGVGTTSPGATFHVSGGAIRIDDSQQLQFGNGNVNLRNDSSGRLYLRAPLAYFFEGNGGYKMVLDGNSGNLGIGTTSPQEKLHVQNYTTGESHQAMFKGGAVTVGDYSYISLNNGYSAEYNKEVRLAAVSEQSNSNKTGFAVLTSPDANGASGHERLRVTADGNVGIGTTSPDSKLHVKEGDITIEGYNTSRYLRFIEPSGSFQGGYVNYDGASNIFKIGVHNTSDSSTSNDQDAIEIIRSTGQVDLNYGGAQKLKTQSSGISINGILNILDDSNPLIYFRTGGNTIEGGVGMADATLLRFAVGSSGLGSDTKMVVRSDGNVGIGTTSPNHELVVQGTSNPNIELKNSNYSDGGFVLNRTNYNQQWKWWAQSSQMYFGFSTNESIYSNKMTIQSGGNVGIGTTSPSYKLDVAGDLRVDNGNVGSTSGDEVEHVKIQGARHFLKFKEVRTANDSDWRNTTFKIQAGVDATNHQSIDFVADGSYLEHIDIRTGNQVFNTRFTSSGNVGIGTTSPAAKLEVEQSNSGTGTVFLSNSYNNKGFRTGNAGYATFSGYQDANNTTSGNAYGALIGLNTFYNGTSFYNDNQYVDPSSILFKDGDIKFHTNDISATGNFTPSERLRITKTGNVGIGTTSPSEKLHVYNGTSYVTPISYAANQSAYALKVGAYNNTSFDMGLQLKSTSGGSPYMSFKTNSVDDVITMWGGSVGVGGTGLPSYTLDVNGSIASSVSSGFPELRLSDAVSDFLLTTNSVGDGIIKTEGTSKNIRFFNNSGETMRISGGGNVGIGTTSPAQKLHVIGNSEITGDIFLGRYIFHNDDNNTWIGFPSSDTITLRTNNSDRVRVTSIGNVGIGTSTPLYLLDAAGTIRCTSLIQTSQSDKKENINDINKSKPRAIPFKEYRYKSNIDSTGRKRYGVLAEDIEDDYPELVYVDSNGEKAVNYIDLLVKRVAELEKELDDISLTPGPKGDKGDTGAVGQRGATGPAGADGKDGSGGDTTVYGCKGEVVGTLGNMVLCEDTVRYQILDPKSGKQIDTLIIPRILK